MLEHSARQAEVEDSDDRLVQSLLKARMRCGENIGVARGWCDHEVFTVWIARGVNHSGLQATGRPGGIGRWPQNHKCAAQRFAGAATQEEIERGIANDASARVCFWSLD